MSKNNIIYTDDDKMRIGACIQLETYIENIDLMIKQLLIKIEENSSLFNNLPYGDIVHSIESANSLIWSLHVFITNNLGGGQLDYCEYLKKYNN